ncbi:beta-galactosidase trimerization domain-containing protein [Lichenicoccus sp.]|uniref:beta-galactosidase trimerization domain-containing protein n=1 Tax=Lichenicoccus sp. TaxID=2781899 RepID=UPI003D1034EA
MRYRQIHLDFHTSERIPGIGTRFDAERFGGTFKRAHVNSVTVFSKCHHGLSYHPTSIGTQHPHLSFDLLRAQIDALHANGINAPIYLTAAWDELAAREHPEWRIVDENGSQPRHKTVPLGAGWAFLDFTSPYLDYLCRQTEEVMQRYPDGDGIFMDICFQLPTSSVWAQARMELDGLDWTDPEHRSRFAEQVQIEFFERIQASVRKYDQSKPLFFNFGHVRRGRRDILRYFTHLEIESLPTAGWGYEHFPLSARYVETLGIEFLGQTGKFHHHWGEVGGYKPADALLYECGAMLAQGARCLIGDHLHPTAALDETTYRAVGVAYAHIEACEPWAEGSGNVAEIGLISAEATARPALVGMPGRQEAPDEGAVRALLEGQFTFDVLDNENDLSPYRLVILPDVVSVTPALKARLDAYVGSGGRVLLTGRSGISPSEGFLFDVGASWEGASVFTQGDYLLPVNELRADFVSDPLYMYLPSQRIRVTDGTSLGVVHDPYFDRSPRAFSGHVNTPSCPEPSGFDSGSAKGAFVYLAHPVFSAYQKVGAVAMLQVIHRAIARALGRPKTLRTGLPLAGRATLRHQPALSRYIVHLMHATPALRGTIDGDAVQPIQDLVTLPNVAVSIGLEQPVSAVRLVPGGDPIPFETVAGRIEFILPALRGHQMVELAH